MFLKIWRFITIILTALLTGATFCHTLELPAKMNYPAVLYLILQKSLYGMFGPRGVGAYIELGAVLATIILLFLLDKGRRAFILTLVATICLLIAFPVLFFLFNSPVNAIWSQVNTPESIPANWMALRNQWEYSHAARFVLHLIALCALVLSVIFETPIHRPQASMFRDVARMTRR